MSTNFNHMAAQLILRDGKPVRQDNSYYGWADYDYYWHVKGGHPYPGTYPNGPCEVVLGSDLNVYADRVSEFAGTDASSDNYEVMELRGLTCACGVRENVTWRYRGELGETVRIMMDAGESVVPQFVPKDEVDTMISLAIEGTEKRLSSFQTDVQVLADTYTTAASSTQSDKVAKILALVAADLLQALRDSEKP